MMLKLQIFYSYGYCIIYYYVPSCFFVVVSCSLLHCPSKVIGTGGEILGVWRVIILSLLPEGLDADGPSLVTVRFALDHL